MTGLNRLQEDKIKELSKYDKVRIDLIVTTFRSEFEGASKSFIRSQLIDAYLDGKPSNKDLLTIKEQWLIRHLIDNVKLCKMPKRAKVKKLKPRIEILDKHFLLR